MALVHRATGADGDGSNTVQALACAVIVEGSEQSEKLFLTSLVAVSGSTVDVSLPGDGYTERLSASVVGRAPEVDLALLALPAELEATANLPSLPVGDSRPLAESDFVILMGNPNESDRGGAFLGLLSGRATLPSLAPPPDELKPARVPPPGTAEAAMAQAEAEAEADAEARGEQPFLVTQASGAEALLRGGPLLSAEGEVVGFTSLVLSDGNSSKQIYSITAERAVRAIGAMIDRRSLGEPISGARVVLFNDPINKRENVQKVLAAAGLSDQAANLAMYSAHRTGRGIIGYFDKPEDARALVKQIAELGKELPSALIISAEECDFYRQPVNGDGGGGAETASQAA